MTFRGALGPVPLSTAQYLEWVSFSPTLFQHPKCTQARCLLVTSSQRLGVISCCQLILIYHKAWFPPISPGHFSTCLLRPFTKQCTRSWTKASAKPQMESSPGFPWLKFLHLGIRGSPCALSPLRGPSEPTGSKAPTHPAAVQGWKVPFLWNPGKG